MEIINLELYKTFYVAACTGNLTKAAEILFTGQPSVSKSIKRLEDLLQTTLFIRSRQGVTLTADGVILFDHVEKALHEINEGELAVKRSTENTCGNITIGVSAALYDFAILPALKGFLDSHPDFIVNIADNSKSHKIIELIKNQALDVGIVSKPLDLEGIDFFPISTVDEIVVAAPEYVKQFDTSDIKTFFSQAALISMEEGNVSRDYNNMYFQQLEINVKPEIVTSSMGFIIKLVTLGVGIGIVYKQLVEEELLEGRLVALDFLPRIDAREIGIIMNKNRLCTFAMKEFIEYYIR